MNHITFTQKSDSAFLHAVGEPPDDCNCPSCVGEPPDEDALVRCEPCRYSRWFAEEDLAARQERSPIAPCGCLWESVEIRWVDEDDEVTGGDNGDSWCHYSPAVQEWD